MSLKILSWNIEGRLTSFSRRGRGTPEHILAEIKRHNADVAVLPEASDGDDVSDETIRAIELMGYEIHTVYYDDKGARFDAAEANPTLKLLSRRPVTNVRRLRYGNVRNALVVDIIDEEKITYRFFCIHLDDRSEANRQMQVKEIVGHITASPYPVVVMGDFNAMHASDMKARLLRSGLFRAITRTVSHPRAKDMLRRLSEMASGETLRRLEAETDVIAVDNHHRPTSTPKLRGMTWLPSVRLIQIDHIYLAPTIESKNFKIARDGGSDHRALSVIISPVRPSQ
jgi:endonuclease/exonuclease/phosphatase family metal-dependent hydrolase